MSIHLRIHTKGLVKTEVLEFLHAKSDVLIVCIEKSNTDREHMHCVIEPKKTLSTFRQQFKKKFPTLVGNKDYSLETIKTTKERMIRYCCKGENKETLPTILFSRKDIDVKGEHNLYYSIIDESKGETNVKPKQKALSWSEKVFSQMLEEFTSECNVIKTYSHIWKPTEMENEMLENARKTLWCHMLKCLGKSVKKINENILRDMFNGYINAINQEGENGKNYALKLYKICYQK